MNPNDVFPRRNLPGAAEEWGRTVEDRIRDVENAAITNKQSTSGLNRTTASNLEELSRQLDDLQTFYNLIPKPAQASNEASGFGLSSGWNTVVQTTIPVPAGATTANLIVVGSGHLVSTTTTTTVASSSRLVLSGIGVSPTLPGAWFTGFGDYRSLLTPTYSWTCPVTPGGDVIVGFQILPSNSSAYGPNADSYAVLSVMATFTGW